jgi:hypothetical protein
MARSALVAGYVAGRRAMRIGRGASAVPPHQRAGRDRPDVTKAAIGDQYRENGR